MQRYSIIYADPPWSFKYYSAKGAEQKSADAHYPCMTLSEIKALPVQSITEDDCVLFLWVTMPCLLQGLDVIKAWGFTYKTCAFTWLKQCRKSDAFFTGCGYWTRANAELCLLATRGHPRRISKSVKQICVSRVREHSRKPDEIRDRIVQLIGDLPRIELFARSKIDGWDAFGNEVESDIQFKETIK